MRLATFCALACTHGLPQITYGLVSRGQAAERGGARHLARKGYTASAATFCVSLCASSPCLSAATSCPHFTRKTAVSTSKMWTLFLAFLVPHVFLGHPIVLVVRENVCSGFVGLSARALVQGSSLRCKDLGGAGESSRDGRVQAFRCIHGWFCSQLAAQAIKRFKSSHCLCRCRGRRRCGRCLRWVLY